MKIFVTGATGVVGRRAVPLLRQARHQVTGVARSAAAREGLVRQGVAPIAVDLFDRTALARALAGHDAVINLATHIPRSSASMFLRSAWRENDRLREIASAALVDAASAAGIARFVQESFAPVYPDCGSEWIDEQVPLSTVRYNRSILSAEAAARRFANDGAPHVILRFGAFYGADAVQTRALIDAVKRGWAPLPGPSSAYISSVSHDDAASAVVAALSAAPGTYNVVDDEPVSHAEFAGSLAKLLGVRAPRLPPAGMTFLFGSLGRMLARSLRISNRKLRAAPGWRPRYPSVRDGWQAVIDEMRAAPRAAA